MDQLHFEATLNHNIVLKDRKILELSGVKRIESFDTYEFLIETSLGYLNIIGSELCLVKLDQEANEVSIRGHIDSLNYVTDKKKVVKQDKGFSKLLK